MQIFPDKITGIIITMEKHEVMALAKEVYDDDQIAELEHAINFATEKHEGQKRKSGKPYIRMIYQKKNTRSGLKKSSQT